MDKHINDAVLGHLFDMNIGDIVTEKVNAVFCKKCQREGIDYLFHNQPMGFELLGAEPKLHRLELRDGNGEILPCMVRVDTPVHIRKDGSLGIRGWCLYGGNIDSIQISCNGTVLGEAIYGVPRPDVDAVFPVYKDSNAGFQFDVDFLFVRANDIGENNITALAYAQGVLVGRAEIGVSV
jgi:hypothetical protein